MKADNKRKTIVIICAAALVALLVLFAVQITKMGTEATLFFDALGLPTILFDICAVMFGVILIILGKNVDESNTSLRKLCKVIGILEIISAVLYFIMTQLIISAIK